MSRRAPTERDHSAFSVDTKMSAEQGQNNREDDKLPYGYGLAFPTLFRLRVRRLNLLRWTLSLWAAGLLIGTIYSWLRGPAAAAKPATWFDNLIIALIYFLGGSPGFLFAVRREAVGRGGTFRGRDAFIFGIFL